MVLLDRVLAHYGSEAKEDRDLLRQAVARTLDQIWHQEQQGHSQLVPTAAGGEMLYDKIQALSPTSDTQSAVKAQAASMAIDLGKMRWLMFQQATTSVSLPLLVVLISWLTLVFISFGLFAPPNLTVIGVLFLCALSVSGAVFLILAMYTPFEGLMQISSAPVRSALAHLGQ